jgi:hypothetical protein
MWGATPFATSRSFSPGFGLPIGGAEWLPLTQRTQVAKSR